MGCSLSSPFTKVAANALGRPPMSVARRDPMLTINLRSLGGENLGDVSIESLALGRDLVAKARALLGQPHGIVAFVCGAAAIREDIPVGQQGLSGAVARCVIAPVTEQQESSIRESVLQGRDLLAGQWQVWDGIEHLQLDRILEMTLPISERQSAPPECDAPKQPAEPHIWR